MSLSDCGVELAEDDMLFSCTETVGEETIDVRKIMDKDEELLILVSGKWQH